MGRYLGLWRELMALSWRRQRGLTALMFVLHAATVGGVAGVAVALRETVDAALRGDAGVAVVAALGAATAYGVMAVLRELTDNLTILVVERVGLTDLMDRLHRDLLTLEGLEHLERADFLDRVTVVRGSAWGLMAAAWAGVGVVFTLGQLGLSLWLLAGVNPWLLLLVAFAAAPLACDQVGNRIVARAETETAEAFRLQRHLFDLATAADSGKEIRVAGAGEELARRQAAAWDEVWRGRVRAQTAAAVWQFGGWTLFTAGFVGALALVAHLAATGRGTVGDVVLAITLATTLQQSVRFTVERVSQAAGARRLVEPYLWLREYVAAERERARSAARAPAPRRLTQGITFDAVSYVYPGTDRPALDSVTVTLPAGSVVAVVGEYGSGKTTLVKLLQKFYRPTAGTVRVDGTDLAELDTEGWRARSSGAFQDFGRFETRFAEVVGIGDLPHVADEERVADAVRAADAERVVARLPDGMATQLGRRLGGVELSEGQWQKTALARAVMRREPLLFVLDEPTASLDAPSEQEIFERHMAHVRAAASRTGAITVIVSHRFSTVTGADLTLVLDGGRLVEAGTHEELMAARGRYAELYGIQETAYTS
ncbi:ATP-binding cassette domain-containing protein [Streptomyces sp. 4N509B]|uniref:ATP-binding cassette domain-containing protein n=1 Tax=Streptomyces sp. 4N509B TaxID=3457413 RepID=UPI003FD18553